MSTFRNLSNSMGPFFLRVTVGSLMLFGHGLSKLSNYSEHHNNFPDPIGLGNSASMLAAIFAEVFCAALVVLGIGTRLAALPVAFTMFVAAGIVHAQDPFAKQEFALLYGICFLTLFFIGGGMFSLGNRVETLRRWS